MLLTVFNKNEKQLSTLSGFKAEQCLPLLKEKICSQRHLLKLSKKDFIQGKEDCRDSYRDRCKAISQWRAEIRLNSKQSMRKWEFIAKEQGEGPWTENYCEEASGRKGILAKPT